MTTSRSVIPRLIDKRRAQSLPAVACAGLLMLCGSGANAQLPARSHGDVRIYRDAKGVPHVVGQTSAAVMFGLGYALARDRLVQMELNRRAAQGRRAEVLGASAVALDIIARDRSLKSSELMRMYAAIPQEHQMMMQSFVDGINRQIEEIKKDPAHKTPYEFTQWGIQPQPWTLLDFLGYVASVPNSRESDALKNLAFLEAMVAQQTQDSQSTESGSSGASVDERKTELQDLIKQKQALEAQYTPDYPDVVAISRKIADLKAEIARASAEPAPAPAASTSNRSDPPRLLQLKAQLRAAQASMANSKEEQARIEQQIRTYQARIESRPQVEEQYKQVTRDHETALEFYNSLLKKADESSMATRSEERRVGKECRP